MSQIAGRILPQTSIPQQNFSFASVGDTDHHGNAGVHTVAFGPAVLSYVDDTDPNLMYFGDAAPGTLPAEGYWRICRATLVSPGVSKYEWAYVPAAGAVPAIYAGFDHIWNNRALLTYA